MAEQGAVKMTPKLRFPEFMGDPWGHAPGDKLFDQISNRDADVGLPILAITQEHGAIPRDLIDYHVSVTEKSIETYKVVERGDFIISLRSFQGGIEYSNYRGVCSPAYVILRKKGEGISAYFKHLFKSARFIQQLTRNIEGLRDGKMISYKQFSDQLIPTPKLAEQQRIADCLTSLDEVIAAQGRKVEALKAHKRGLMQQLFPREGETRPRLRFPEFRDAPEWELKTLSSVCDMQAGKFVSASEISDQPVDGRFPCYGGNGLRGYTSSFTHSGTFPLIGRQGALCGNVQLAEGDFYATEHALVVSPKRGVVVPWLYYTLGKLELNRFATGQAQPGLSVDVLKAVECSVPATELEQQRIADCLTSVDMQIAAESNQLAALKTHKQGLMQQLFPAPEATGA